MRVKICGITNRNDALFCEKKGAGMLGFVFYNRSRRFIDFGSALEIIRLLSPSTEKIGVFVNETAEVINRAADKLNLSGIQLHGDESPDFQKQIILPVIKAFRVGHDFNFSSLLDFEGARPLLDTYSPDAYGGTGHSFDWEMIPEDIRNKIILAGSISASNVSYICNRIQPYAVDLSSSLESRPGIKDHNKVEEFFMKIKR